MEKAEVSQRPVLGLKPQGFFRCYDPES